jgi:16S rRNA (uracil1498-N3)-methyltransferase
MHRFYIPFESWNLDALALDESETHHAVDVLRMNQGDKAVVFNGRGAEATVEIAAITRKSVTLRKLLDGKSAPIGCAITLAQAVPKGKNMDLIVQKAVELGAAAICPLLSERTVVQVEEDDATRKQQKWQAVAIEAAKQCGQNWLPRVAAPVGIKEFFGQSVRHDLMLIASLQPDAMHLKKLLADYGDKKPKSVLVLVGPEGDFTPAEISLARSQGCRPITLGPIVLRTETAAIYCLSVLSYELFGAA